MKATLPDGRRVDPATGEVADPEERPAVSRAALARIRSLELAASALGSHLSAERNAAQRRRLEGLCATAEAEAAAVRRKLEHGWDWLEAHQDDERADRYHGRWLGWLVDYEALCDAVAVAREALA